jgi:two-component system sensor histidine kinase ChvG
VVFLPLYFLNRYTIESFDKFTRTALEEEMISQAFMLGEQYKTMLLGAGRDKAEQRQEEFATTLTRYSEQVQSRLQILSPEGIVLFDSDPDSLVGADFSGRKEIANIIAGGSYKAAWRLTGNGSHVFYFVPLPIRHGDDLIGIAYVTHHTGQITKAIMKMVHDQRLAMIAALLLAVLLSAVLAQTMTWRLRRLTKTSKEYAKGNAPLKVEARGRDEIGELGRAVTHMAAEIEKRNEYNREFMSTVMHELKAPITAIKGAAEVLEQGAADKAEARDKFLGNILYEANRLTRMVGELNELTKLDAEVLTGHKEKVDYCVSVREILDRLMPTFDQAHASFSAEIPQEAITAMIVPGRIEQVISNLLDNAFRYTPVEGRVELKVELQPDGYVFTSVKDTGPGIQEASIGKVFDRFYTTERRGSPKEYGSGLGLAIARSIVENHRGRIWVQSLPGKGACFTFSLPITKS